MKIDFYVDIYPGTRPDYLMAVQNPSKKSEGVKRYRITASIPDHAFTDIIDGSFPVEEVKEVDV